MAVHEPALAFLSSFTFFMVKGGPMEGLACSLLLSCINSEIIYKRPFVSTFVVVLQMQA